MKKGILLLILAACLIGSAIAQPAIYKVKAIDVATATDTTLIVAVPVGGHWSAQVDWDSVVGSGAVFSVSIGDTDSTFAAYPDTRLPYTIVGAGGSQVFFSGKNTTRYIKLTLTKGSATAGDIYLRYNLNRF